MPAEPDIDLVRFVRANRRTLVHIQVGFDQFALCGVGTRSMMLVSPWVLLHVVAKLPIHEIPGDRDRQRSMAVIYASCATCVAEFAAKRLENRGDRDSGG